MSLMGALCSVAVGEWDQETERQGPVSLLSDNAGSLPHYSKWYSLPVIHLGQSW